MTRNSSFPIRGAALATVAILAAAGCSPSSSTAAPSTATSTVAQATPAQTAAPASQGPAPAPSASTAYARNPAPYATGSAYAVTIEPAAFVPTITNPWFPMVQGATFVFDGAEHIEVKVLPDTKTILGVTVTVVSDKVFEDGELVEDTLDYYAQDIDGNVWYFGEETAEYKNGKVTSRAGSWAAGLDGAQAGIIMLAHPQVGDTYRQEFLVGEAEDVGMITALTGSITVPFGNWSGADVLVTEEWTPLEPDVRERKTYVHGIGVVETRVIEGGDEVVTLTKADVPALVGG